MAQVAICCQKESPEMLLNLATNSAVNLIDFFQASSLASEKAAWENDELMVLSNPDNSNVCETPWLSRNGIPVTTSRARNVCEILGSASFNNLPLWNHSFDPWAYPHIIIFWRKNLFWWKLRVFSWVFVFFFGENLVFKQHCFFPIIVLFLCCFYPSCWVDEVLS